MFRKAKWISFTLLFLFISLIYFKVFHSPIINVNTKKYHNFSTKTEMHIPDEPFQYRKKIIKDLYLNNKGERLHYHLESPSSTLQLLAKDNNAFELTEKFDEMRMWMYEGDIRFIKAQNSTCFYVSQLLEASDVLFGSYQTNIDAMEIEGSAKEVKLFFNQNPPLLEANSFNANFNPREILP